MQRIINLTRGVSETHKKIRLHQEFRKDILMWELFLSHWNGVSLFLSPSPPLKFICIPTEQALLAMGLF